MDRPPHASSQRNSPGALLHRGVLQRVERELEGRGQTSVRRAAGGEGALGGGRTVRSAEELREAMLW